MSKSGVWSACLLAVVPLMVTGGTCVCPIKRLLAPEKCGGTTAPTTQAKSATTRPTSRPAAPRATAATRRTAPATMEQAVAQARETRKPIYIEFSADWCMPCRIYEKTVLKTAKGKEALSRVVFYHVNVDKEPGLAKRFGVTGVPTGLLVKPAGTGSDVKVLNRHVGGLSLAELQEFLGQE